MATKLVLIFAFCVASLHAHSRELCENGQGKFDVIVSTSNQDVYVLKGERVWRLIGDKDRGFQLDRNGFPRLISTVWPGLPSDIDAAYTDYASKRTYFFKDSRVWVFRDYRLQPGYPKTVSQEFSNLPNAIDGAFMCTGVNYFFKGNSVYNGRTGAYKTNIGSQWRGLPDKMHAAIQFPSKGHTFFFKDYQFYKYRVWNGPVESGYPKNVVPFWFQCETPEVEQSTPETSDDYFIPDTEVEGVRLP